MMGNKNITILVPDISENYDSDYRHFRELSIWSEF